MLAKELYPGSFKVSRWHQYSFKMYFTQLLLNKSTAIFFGLLLIFKSHDEQNKRKMSIVVMIENQMLKFKCFLLFLLSQQFHTILSSY